MNLFVSVGALMSAFSVGALVGMLAPMAPKAPVVLAVLLVMGLFLVVAGVRGA